MVLFNGEQHARLSLRSLWRGSGIDRVRSGLATRRTQRRLEALQARAASASASFRPQHYQQAARLATELGQHDRALALYGRAIDGHLEAGRSKAAEALCRQVLETYPAVVRTRRTLALLAIGRGDAEEAAARVREYVAASRGGDRRLLRRSLRMIAQIARSPEVRGQALAELRAMGDEAGIQQVLQSDGPPDHEAFDDTAGPWTQAMQAALLGVDRLRELRV